MVTTKKEVEALGHLLTGRKENLEKLVQSIPDMKLLSDIREWYGGYHHLQEEEKQAREEGVQVENALARDREEIVAWKRENPLFAGVKDDTYDSLSDACPGEATAN